MRDSECIPFSKANDSHEIKKRICVWCRNALVDEYRAADMAAYSEVVKSWIEQTKADPEIGGERLAENLAFGADVIDRFGTPGAFALLRDSGIINNPGIVSMFVKIGRELCVRNMENK